MIKRHLGLMCVGIVAQSSTRSSRSKEVTHMLKKDRLLLPESQFIVDVCKARSDIYLNIFIFNAKLSKLRPVNAGLLNMNC